MSNSKGITMQQQGKNIQNGRPQHLPSSNITKGTQAMLDEFKYGFPSDGLAVASYKWWGSSSLAVKEDASGSGGEDVNEDKRKIEELVDDGAHVLLNDGERPGSGNDGSNIDPQGVVLLSRVSKRAAEEGREALRLGVYRGYCANKLGRRERKLLLRIFKSSLPIHCRNGSSAS